MSAPNIDFWQARWRNSCPTNSPPCVDWDVWLGPECEGEQHRNEPTLFVRRATLDQLTSFLARSKAIGFTRVWFCWQFQNWSAIEHCVREFRELKFALEIWYPLAFIVPNHISASMPVYLKIPDSHYSPKVGDTICYGPPFGDEAFTSGSGIKSLRSDYLEDTRIL